MFLNAFPNVTTEPNFAHSLPLVAESNTRRLLSESVASGAENSVRKF
jgi:hypothetical protein